MIQTSVITPHNQHNRREVLLNLLVHRLLHLLLGGAVVPTRIVMGTHAGLMHQIKTPFFLVISQSAKLWKSERALNFTSKSSSPRWSWNEVSNEFEMSVIAVRYCDGRFHTMGPSVRCQRTTPLLAGSCFVCMCCDLCLS